MEMETTMDTGKEKAQAELIQEILLPRIMRDMDSMKNQINYLQWLVEVMAKGNLKFEIGESPCVTDIDCTLCGRVDRPPEYFCVRIAEYDIKYNCVCDLCSESLAPELLPELERRRDEIYKEVYGPDYKKEIEVSQSGDGEPPF